LLATFLVHPCCGWCRRVLFAIRRLVLIDAYFEGFFGAHESTLKHKKEQS